MKRLIAIAVSIRTTAALLVAMGLLLLAGLLAPQATPSGDPSRPGVAHSRTAGMLSETLDLSTISTSPFFLALLGAFYLNLIAVLIDRTPRTLARTRVKVPNPEAASKWIASSRALEGTAAGALDGSIPSLLRGHGFRPHGVASRTFYGVKHRNAALGFLVFHFSFFLLCAGGAMIWATRWVGEVRVVEGQRVEAPAVHAVRMPRFGKPPEVAFTVDRIAPAFERGEATDLRASVRFDDTKPSEAWVNHPAAHGTVNVLVHDVGLAPVLWLQDPEGYGVDRLAVPAERRKPVDAPLAGGSLQVRILPPAGTTFPARDALSRCTVPLVVSRGGTELFRGSLTPGQAARFPGGVLVLQEVRYWAGLRIVSERGGLLLVIGFTLATIGAIWRLLLRRRDVLIAWEGARFRLIGHGEFFNERDHRELLELRDAIERHGSRSGIPAPADHAEVTV